MELINLQIFLKDQIIITGKNGKAGKNFLVNTKPGKTPSET
jgi:ABC-type uncharacterized transport system ATPase component